MSPRDTVLVEMVRQNWEHLRHIERLRMGMASFYAVLVAAVLAVLAQVPLMNQRPLLIVLAALSIFEVFVTLRFNAHVPFRLGKLRDLAQELSVANTHIAYFGAEGWTTYIRYRWVFLVVYLLATVVFAWLSFLGCLAC